MKPSLISMLVDNAKRPLQLAMYISRPITFLVWLGVVLPVMLTSSVLTGLLSLALKAMTNVDARQFFKDTNKAVFTGMMKALILVCSAPLAAVFTVIGILPLTAIAYATRKFKPKTYIDPIVSSLVQVTDDATQRQILNDVIEKYNKSPSRIQSQSSRDMYCFVQYKLRQAGKLYASTNTIWPKFFSYMADEGNNGKNLFNIGLGVLEAKGLVRDEVSDKQVKLELKRLYSLVFDAGCGQLGFGIFSPKVPKGIRKLRHLFQEQNIKQLGDIDLLSDPHYLAMLIEKVAYERTEKSTTWLSKPIKILDFGRNAITADIYAAIQGLGTHGNKKWNELETRVKNYSA